MLAEFFMEVSVTAATCCRASGRQSYFQMELPARRRKHAEKSPRIQVFTTQPLRYSLAVHNWRTTRTCVTVCNISHTPEVFFCRPRCLLRPAFTPKATS